MKTTDNTTPETEFPVRMSIKLANYYQQCEVQRDAALAALRELVDVNERIGAPAITQGGLCEEQDWTHGMRQARAVIAATQGGAQ